MLFFNCFLFNWDSFGDLEDKSEVHTGSKSYGDVFLNLKPRVQLFQQLISFWAISEFEPRVVCVGYSYAQFTLPSSQISFHFLGSFSSNKRAKILY